MAEDREECPSMGKAVVTHVQHMGSSNPRALCGAWIGIGTVSADGSHTCQHCDDSVETVRYLVSVIDDDEYWADVLEPEEPYGPVLEEIVRVEREDAAL